MLRLLETILLLNLKCLYMCGYISVLGWLSDKGQGKIIILMINNVFYTSVLTMFQSDRELLPVIHCVAYFNFEDICKDLGKVQLPWCITENSATTIQL